jgi:hypothetical protein
LVANLKLVRAWFQLLQMGPNLQLLAQPFSNKEGLASAALQLVFALFHWHLESYTPGQDQAKQYVPVCTGLYLYVLVHSFNVLYIHSMLVHTGTYRYMLGRRHVIISYTQTVICELNSTVYMFYARDMKG